MSRRFRMTGVEILPTVLQVKAAHEPESELAKSNGIHVGAKAHEDEPKRSPLNWTELTDRTPPARHWALEGWLGMGHATLCAGGAGTGKSLLAQTIATSCALGKAYLCDEGAPQVSLGWFGEDDRDELWRRQTAINSYFEIQMPELDKHLWVESFDGRDMLLAEPSAEFRGRLLATPLLEELRAQVGDYRATVVVLDTVARIFGGNENDRVQVTQFLHCLVGAMPHPVALLLLAHPSRGIGAEFSGSSAWEGSVRSRWYFGRNLPDAKDDDDAPTADSVRYLARRKVNYSSRDWIALDYDIEHHVLVPQAAQSKGDQWYRESRARDVVMRGLRELISRNVGHPTGANTSPRYLPKMLGAHSLSEGVPASELKAALNRLMADRRLVQKEVGVDNARRPISGLVEVSP